MGGNPPSRRKANLWRGYPLLGDGAGWSPDGKRRAGHGRCMRGVRSGARQRVRKPQALGIFFSNTTSASDKAKQYYIHDTTKFDICMMAESHQREADVKAWAKELDVSTTGFSLAASVATQSTRTSAGCFGGVNILYSNAISAAPPADYDRIPGHRAAFTTDQDIAALHVGIRPGELLAMGGYFEGAGIYSPGNLQRWATVDRITVGGKKPFMLFADFNCEPKDLADAPWIEKLQAEVVPFGPTCFSPLRESSLDFGVFSKCLRPLWFGQRTISPVPWGPHIGIGIQVRRDAEKLFFRRARCPKPLEVPGAREDPRLDDSRWSEARAAAAQHVTFDGTFPQLPPDHAGHQPLSCIVEYIRESGLDGDEAVAVSASFASWSRASELFILRTGGIDIEDHNTTRPYLGRGQLPRFVWEPVIKQCHTPFALQGTYRGDCALSSCWAAAHNAITLLFALARRAKNEKEWQLQRGRVNHMLIFDPKFAWATDRLDDNLRPIWADLVWRFAFNAAACAGASAARSDDDFFKAGSMLLTLTDKLYHAATAEYRLSADARWKEWLATALDRGAGPAHKWSKAPFSLPAAPAFLPDPDGESLITAPHAVTEELANGWDSTWRREGEKRSDVIIAISDLRRQAADAGTPSIWATPPDPDGLRVALNHFSLNTGVGIDGWRPRDWKRLPDAALAELGQMLATCMSLAILPLQIFLVFLVLLGKKSGDSRCIALIATFYRVAMAASKSTVSAWDSKRAGFWDSAVAGASPLRAGLARALRMETATINGKYAAISLWDLKGFYDSVRISDLIAMALKHGFPIQLLAIGLVMHIAPRALRHGRGLSRAITSTRSILAGCIQSVSWCRALLYDVMEAAHYSIPGSMSGEHVDDVAQITIADTMLGLKNRLVAGGRLLHKGFVSLGLTLSDKSVMLPNSLPAVGAAATELTKLGITIKTARVSKDIGLGTGGGRHRETATLRDRMQSGRQQASRVGYLAKHNARARRLATTGVVPRQSYGHTAQGASPKQVSACRRNLVNAVAGELRGGSSTTAIEWWLGQRGDPGINMPHAQIKDWIDLWRSSSAVEKRDTRIAWRKRVLEVQRHRAPWQLSGGPMTATILTLKAAGWKPMSPSRWLDHTGTRIANIEDGVHVITDILHYFDERMRSLVWATAAEHFSGGGLERGPPLLAPAKRAYAYLRKRGRHRQAHELFRVCCGATWPKDRIDDTKRLRCPRCGKEGESALHRYWTCPALKGADIVDVKSSDYICKEVGAGGWFEHPCLYGRALLPFDLWHAGAPDRIDAVDAKALDSFTGGADSSLWQTADEFFTDGSGGPDFVPRAIRAAGSGIVCAGPASPGADTHAAALRFAQVPGRQTPPRAEVWGAVHALRLADPARDITIAIDASYAVKGLTSFLSSGDLRPLAGVNGDIWAWAFDAIRARTGRTTIRKVRAHPKPSHFETGESNEHDLLWNGMADYCADQASGLYFRPAQGDIKEHERWNATTFLIALRLSAIELDLHINHAEGLDDVRWLALPTVKPALSPEDILVDLLAKQWAAGHDLVKANGWIRCRRCLRRKKPTTFNWTSQPCVGLSPAEAARKRSAALAALAAQPEPARTRTAMAYPPTLNLSDDGMPDIGQAADEGYDGSHSLTDTGPNHHLALGPLDPTGEVMEYPDDFPSIGSRDDGQLTLDLGTSDPFDLDLDPEVIGRFSLDHAFATKRSSRDEPPADEVGLPSKQKARITVAQPPAGTTLEQLALPASEASSSGPAEEMANLAQAAASEAVPTHEPSLMSATERRLQVAAIRDASRLNARTEATDRARISTALNQSIPVAPESDRTVRDWRASDFAHPHAWAAPHFSHALRVAANQWLFCNRCGSMTSGQLPQKLKDCCNNVPADHGAANRLKRLKH